ncbi:hypothetical protein UFOVP112_28 [uncultured Caudovirales phage]|uniref:Uncharacterized protein n=1 Tax=uncultured Caudovirales phage TaxID=2100421 RepID=A0A6J5L257_9CAUD|nr:hypothetical protein UFOVP112_28 [uncultured Caudovirales phage]
MIWFIIGLALGYGIGINQRANDIPKDLEKCTVERSQQEIDIAYYKKLTQDLVKENTELRRILNGNKKN